MPDLNTVPRSPRVAAIPQAPVTATTSATGTLSSSQSASRRTSTQMLPPPLPQNHSLPSSPRPSQAIMMDNTGVGLGPGALPRTAHPETGSLSEDQTIGPIRHPRPLTAAELHLELEKEQESIVNRLTRELSALRAQTASVASTTSSTASDHFFSSSNDPYTTTNTGGTTIIPTTSRRHRSSSNLSTRSARSIRESLANAAATSSVSGVAAPRDQQSLQASARPSMELSRPDMSRQNSTSASGFRSSSISITSSPHLTQSSGGVGGYAYPHRSSVSSNTNAPEGGSHMVRSPSSNAAMAAARYEEAALQRAELEAVKRENEALRSRVRDLEKSLQRANELALSSGTPP